MTLTARAETTPKLPLVLGFLLLVVGGGALIGIASAPGEWYASLSKPTFTPPNWVFPIAWTSLYLGIAVAGARTFETARYTRRMSLWWAQLGLNFAWTPVFFLLHAPIASLALLVVMLGCIAGFIIKSRRRDPLSAALFVPYACWVGFAGVLNAGIVALN